MKYLLSLMDVPERFPAPPPLAMGKSQPYLLISRCHKTFQQPKLALRAFFCLTMMLSGPLRGQKFYATLISVHKSLGSAMGPLKLKLGNVATRGGGV
jgi:hypothetical protein